MTIRAGRSDYDRLRSELAGLDELLAMMPETAVIHRMSFEARRQKVLHELDNYAEPLHWPEKARLAFNGLPVVGDYGIAVDFANAELTAFSQAVASVGASLRGVALREQGPIPNRNDYSLLITGTVPGSFGFELERNSLAAVPSHVEAAIEHIKAILQSSIGNDEALADAVFEMQPRAISDCRRFLQTMADAQATCSLSFRDDVFRFRDVNQVRYSLSRLSDNNIREEEDAIVGHFLGYLPDSRRFEFACQNNGEHISGRVDPSLENAAAINGILNQRVSINVRVRTVGAGRPRYTAIGYDTQPTG